VPTSESINMSNVPHASEVNPGTIVNVTTPEQRRRLRLGLVVLLVAAAGAGGVAGYLVGRRRRRTNPKRRRRNHGTGARTTRTAKLAKAA